MTNPLDTEDEDKDSDVFYEGTEKEFERINSIECIPTDDYFNELESRDKITEAEYAVYLVQGGTKDLSHNIVEDQNLDEKKNVNAEKNVNAATNVNEEKNVNEEQFDVEYTDRQCTPPNV